MDAIDTAPTTIAICASKKNFQFYSSGILTKKCGTCENHAVLAVGYGTDATTGLDYVRIKNQYGSSWGDGGYIYVYLSKNSKKGVCGIYKEIVYPILA